MLWLRTLIKKLFFRRKIERQIKDIRLGIQACCLYLQTYCEHLSEANGATDASLVQIYQRIEEILQITKKGKL